MGQAACCLSLPEQNDVCTMRGASAAGAVTAALMRPVGAASMFPVSTLPAGMPPMLWCQWTNQTR